MDSPSLIPEGIAPGAKSRFDDFVSPIPARVLLDILDNS